MRYLTYPTTSLFDYLPVRYTATPEQRHNRSEIYSFKDGNCSERVYRGLLLKIKEIIGFNPQNWVVTFIPGSTTARTISKYKRLAIRLANDINATVSMTAIYNKTERQSTMVTGKLCDPTVTFGFNVNEFSGKKVILIDDVITTGRSFQKCGDKLKANGAIGIYGLFVGNTINPDWN